MPSALNVDLADLFHGTIFPCHKLCMFHVWGCPMYILDQKISNGQNIPHLQQKSRRDIFIGYSPTHSSDAPLVLNLTTRNIYPQYHVLFDDTLRTVKSVSDDEYPPLFWNDISLEFFTHQVPFVNWEQSCTSQ